MTTRRRYMAVLTTAGLGLGLFMGAAGVAHAQYTNPQTPDPNAWEVPPAETPTMTVIPPPMHRAPEDTGIPRPPGAAYRPPSNVGIAVTAGGGVSEFAHGDIRANTGMAGSWEFRVAARTRRWVGVEGAYVGAAQSIRGLGLNQEATLVRNGVEGALRLQAPLQVKTALVEPYVFGGVGWNHYDVSNALVSASSLSQTDEVLTVPFGAGIGGGVNGFFADVRFTYRPTYEENLLVGSAHGSLTNWNLGAQVGYEF